MHVDGRARVVQFWRAVEMLSPPRISVPEQPRRTAPDEWVLDFNEHDAAPWSAGHPLTARPLPPNRSRQYTVYGGLYEIDAVRQALIDQFGDDGTPDDGRPSGRTALFAFTVDADGYLAENSGTLSSCAWALGRLRHAGPGTTDWLGGFTAEARAFAALSTGWPRRRATRSPWRASLRRLERSAGTPRARRSKPSGPAPRRPAQR